MMDAWVKKIGKHRGKPRVFLDGFQAIRAGFSPGESFDVEVDGQRITLTKKDDGSRVVSSREKNGRTLPVIDINSGELLKMFEGMESIRIIVTPRAVYLMPLASEVKRVERLERLRAKLKDSIPLSTGSISHGGGVLSHAIHQGLKDAGIEANLAFANEIREDLVVQAIEHNGVWNEQTMALAMPMQELMQDEWVLSKMPPLELLEMGLPCSGASKAGAARKGLEMMETHEHVGHLVAAAIAIVNRVQPTMLLLENVTSYANTASAHILRGTLRDMGYDVHEAVLKGQDFGVIEDRIRWVLIGTTRGLDFDFTDIKPDVSIIRTVDEFIDRTIEPDDPRWKSFDYLKTKRERDETKGNRFLPQVVTTDSTLVPTLRKGVHKGGSSDPRLAHPTDPNLSRLFTAQEHARIKGVPEELIEGLSETNAHQLLGQGIVYEPFRAVGERIAECLMRFANGLPALESDVAVTALTDAGTAATQNSLREPLALGERSATADSVRAAIAHLVRADLHDLVEGVGHVMVLTTAELEGSGVSLSVRRSIAALGDQAQAFHDAGTNTTVFLADRIAAGQEAAVFLHETVHRHGRQALPEGRWDALVGQVKAWGSANPLTPERAIHDAAADRVATAGVAGALADEELFAYAVEKAVAMGIEPTAAAVEGSAEAWLQVVAESIQRISDKLLGNDLQGLGGQGLVDLAYALAQLDSPEHGFEVGQVIESALVEADRQLDRATAVYEEARVGW